MKKQDVQDRKDIEKIVNDFYDEVKENPKLQHFFIHVNWAKHLPVMYNFWENVLFFTGKYSGNPMEVHTKMHSKQPVTKEDFQEWKAVFTKTVKKNFEGKNADIIIQKAQSIAAIMELKILNPSLFSIHK